MSKPGYSDYSNGRVALPSYRINDYMFEFINIHSSPVLQVIPPVGPESPETHPIPDTLGLQMSITQNPYRLSLQQVDIAGLILHRQIDLSKNDADLRISPQSSNGGVEFLGTEDLSIMCTGIGGAVGAGSFELEFLGNTILVHTYRIDSDHAIVVRMQQNILEIYCPSTPIYSAAPMCKA